MIAMDRGMKMDEINATAYVVIMYRVMMGVSEMKVS